MFRRKNVGFGALFLIFLAGCSRPSAMPGALSKTAVRALPPDDLGREIKVSSPRRIISLAPGVTETIFALGLGDRLVGRDQSSDFPSQAKNIAVAGDFNGPFAEKAVALRPDLIIAQGETYDRARVELWQRKCGVPVALLNANTIEGVKRGIEKIAAWLGVPEKAAAIVKQFPAPAKASKLRAFIEVGRTPLWSAGDDTLVGDVLKRAGLRNVAAIRGYKAFNTESLAKANPDFYIVTAAKPDLAATLRELRAVPGLRGLKCIREGRVIVVPADWVLRPGPRLAQGIAEIARQVKSSGQ